MFNLSYSFKEIPRSTIVLTHGAPCYSRLNMKLWIASPVYAVAPVLIFMEDQDALPGTKERRLETSDHLPRRADRSSGVCVCVCACVLACVCVSRALLETKRKILYPVWALQYVPVRPGTI